MGIKTKREEIEKKTSNLLSVCRAMKSNPALCKELRKFHPETFTVQYDEGNFTPENYFPNCWAKFIESITKTVVLSYMRLQNMRKQDFVHQHQSWGSADGKCRGNIKVNQIFAELFKPQTKPKRALQKADQIRYEGRVGLQELGSDNKDDQITGQKIPTLLTVRISVCQGRTQGWRLK